MDNQDYFFGEDEGDRTPEPPAESLGGEGFDCTLP